jgi:hypothetical protein
MARIADSSGLLPTTYPISWIRSPTDASVKVSSSRILLGGCERYPISCGGSYNIPRTCHLSWDIYTETTGKAHPGGVVSKSGKGRSEELSRLVVPAFDTMLRDVRKARPGLHLPKPEQAGAK